MLFSVLMTVRPKKKKTRMQRWGFLILPLFIVAVIGLGFLGVDQMCINDANRRLPFYPDAVQVSEQGNSLRSRGAGNSLTILETEDSTEMVDAWYEELNIELLNSGNTRGINNISRWLESTEDGKTQIFYLSQCVL